MVDEFVWNVSRPADDVGAPPIPTRPPLVIRIRPVLLVPNINPLLETGLVIKPLCAPPPQIENAVTAVFS